MDGTSNGTDAAREVRGTYDAPVIEDLGEIHEVTRHHGKISSHGDSPQGKEHTGGQSGPLF